MLPSRKCIPATAVLSILLIQGCFTERITRCVNEHLYIRCPPGSAINVESAVFGHGNGGCNFNQNDCSKNASSAWRLCHGMSHCSTVVHQVRSPGCPQPSTYMSVQYTCKIVSCHTLMPIAHGDIEYSQAYLTLGQTATYRCGRGFTLAGSDVRYCDANSQWTGIEPVCSVPTSHCPASNDTVITYGHTCYELVSTSTTLLDAARDCHQRGWTFFNGSQTTPSEFLSQEVVHHGWRESLWYGQDSSGCLEWRNVQAWEKHRADCTYLNRYICKHEVRLARLMQIGNTGNTNAYIAVGVVGGILLLVVLVIVVVLVTRRRRRSQSTGHESNDHLQEEDIYYDEAASAGPEPVTTSVPDITKPRYSKVDKKRKVDDNSNETPDFGYDAVYTPKTPSRHPRPSYENMPSQKVIGSLKKRLEHANDETLYMNDTDEELALYMNGTAKQPPSSPDTHDERPVQPSRGKKKPKPAPKPAIPSTIGNPVVPSAEEGDSADNKVPQPTGEVGELASAPSRPEPRRPVVSPRQNVNSELDLIENDLYIEKPKAK